MKKKRVILVFGIVVVLANRDLTQTSDKVTSKKPFQPWAKKRRTRSARPRWRALNKIGVRRAAPRHWKKFLDLRRCSATVRNADATAWVTGPEEV